MTAAPRDRRSLIVASVLVLGVMVFGGKLLFEHIELRMRVIAAHDQVGIFEEMQGEALRLEPAKAVGCLEYVVRYYPSGTKQAEGSKLDQIVERSRRLAVQAILADLRVRSGRDFGNDPEAWISNLKAGTPE